MTNPGNKVRPYYVTNGKDKITHRSTLITYFFSVSRFKPMICSKFPFKKSLDMCMCIFLHFFKIRIVYCLKYSLTARRQDNVSACLQIIVHKDAKMYALSCAFGYTGYTAREVASICHTFMTGFRRFISVYTDLPLGGSLVELVGKIFKKQIVSSPILKALNSHKTAAWMKDQQYTQSHFCQTNIISRIFHYT